MIKNLVINGCSFTDERHFETWATYLAQNFQLESYRNLAYKAAGNHYICNSTIHLLEQQMLNPAETMVIIMWSGTTRKDISVSGEWWYELSKKWPASATLNDQHYYLFSGGLFGDCKNKTIKEIFHWLYKLVDPETICTDSLLNFINLENYLKRHGYQYKFTSFANYWNPNVESTFPGGDYSLGYFCRHIPLYKNFDFSHWFFINDQQDCLFELAQYNNQLDKTNHPTSIAHKQFVTETVIPLFDNIDIMPVNSYAKIPMLHN